MITPPDTPIIRFIFWLVNTPGLGGLGVVVILATCVSSFVAALRWIAGGSAGSDPAAYSYPTPALHEQTHL